MNDRYLQSSQREHPFIRHLPWVFGLTNVAISIPVLIIGVSRQLNGVAFDWPILLLYLVDFPASIVACAWGDLLSDYLRGHSGSEAADMVASYALLLLSGFVWYYFVGRVLRGLIRFMRIRREARRPGFPVVRPTDGRTPEK